MQHAMFAGKMFAAAARVLRAATAIALGRGALGHKAMGLSDACNGGLSMMNVLAAQT
jgi:hypothetical protein